MLDIKNIKIGAKIEYKEKPFEVIEAVFSKIGRQGAVLRSKLKDLVSGDVIRITFHDSDQVNELSIEREKAQYLYSDQEKYYFMNLKNYEQFFLEESALGEKINFLKKESLVEIIYYKEKPINIELPIKIDLEVIDSPPTIRGNTADGGTKKVTVETGYQLNVPLFIEKGVKIKINTENGKYVSRV